VNGSVGTMKHLKMLAGAATPVARPTWVEKIVTVAAEREGVFHASVDRDAHVAQGAKIGFVTDYLNRPLQDVTAPEAGIVMLIRAVPSLKKGDTIVNIGVVSATAK
jgi:predicted deacylase